MNEEHVAMVERYWQGKTKVLAVTTNPKCTPSGYIPGPRDKAQRLTAWWEENI